jgi:hypothetical protein
VKVRVETRRYRIPIVTWIVSGNAISGSGNVTVNMIAETFAGRRSATDAQDIRLEYAIFNDGLEIRAIGTNANFDVAVACTVRDGSITGNLKTDVIAKPTFDIGFVGAKLTLDWHYLRQRDACEKEVAGLFKGNAVGGTRQAPGNPGGPVEFDPGVLNAVPAYARLAQYSRARAILKTIQMADVVMPPDAAANLRASPIADTPVLQAAIARTRRFAITTSE